MIFPFTQAEGLFIPVLSGGAVLSCSSFDVYFDMALAEGDIKVLQTPIFPFFVNALHYFALAARPDGITYCF
jgi:hypothetical protein